MSLMRGANGCRQLGRFPAVCLCVLIGLGFYGFQSESMQCVAMPFMGRPAFPFIGQGKAGVTAEGEEKNQKEKEVPQDHWVLLLFYAGPANPVGINRDSFTSRPYPSLAPCVGIVCLSWRSTLSWRSS